VPSSIWDEWPGSPPNDFRVTVASASPALRVVNPAGTSFFRRRYVPTLFLASVWYCIVQSPLPTIFPTRGVETLYVARPTLPPSCSPSMCCLLTTTARAGPIKIVRFALSSRIRASCGVNIRTPSGLLVCRRVRGHLDFFFSYVNPSPMFLIPVLHGLWGRAQRPYSICCVTPLDT